MRPERAKLLYLAPALAWIFAMVLFPLFYTVGISLFDYTLGAKTTPFSYGLNYLRAVQDYRVWNGLKVSAVFTVVVVSIEFLLGLGLALLLSGRMRGRRTFRLIMLLPLFACPIAVGYLYLMLFHQRGPVNAFVKLLGFATPNWLGDPNLALFTVAFVDIWEWTSFMFLIMLATIESLPVEVHEAAQIDGASGWLTFRKLTFPMLIPTILIALTLRITDAFKIFDIFVGLTKGGPGTSTEVYSMYVFRVTLEYFKFGYSGALSVIFLLIMMVSINVLFLFRRLRKW